MPYGKLVGMWGHDGENWKLENIYYRRWWGWREINYPKFNKKIKKLISKLVSLSNGHSQKGLKNV